MSSPLVNLKKSSLSYAVGNFSVLVLKFFFIPFYTFYLSEEALGWFDLIASAAPLVGFVFSLQSESALLRWGLESKSLGEKRKVISHSLSLLFAALLVFSLAYLFFSPLLRPLIPEPVSLGLLYAYLLSVFIYSFFKPLLRVSGGARHFALGEIVYTLLLVAFILILVVWLRQGLMGLLWAQAGATLGLVLVWLPTTTLRNFLHWQKPDLPYLKQMLRYSSPLVVNSLNLWGLSFMIKYIVALSLSVGSSGLFAVAYKIGFSVQLISKIFNMAWMDKALSSYRDSNFGAYAQKTYRQYSALLFALSLLVIAFQKIIVSTIVSELYQSASLYIPLMVIGFFFFGLSSFLNVFFHCVSDSRSIMLTSLLANLCFLLLGFVLTPWLGLYGAASAFALGNFSLFILRHYRLKKHLLLKLSFPLWGMYIISASLVWWLSQSDGIWLYSLGILSASIASLVTNRETMAQNWPLKWRPLWLSKK